MSARRRIMIADTQIKHVNLVVKQNIILQNINMLYVVIIIDFRAKRRFQNEPAFSLTGKK